MKSAYELRTEILQRVAEFHSLQFAEREFIPGKTPVPVSGKVFDAEDMSHLVDASLDFWLTTGRFADAFEMEFAKFLGINHASLCNSGSSANLLAISALTSPKLGSDRLKEGDEVITLAAGFPTTVAPIYQNEMLPVYVDIDMETYNADVKYLEAAIGPRTRAIFLPHTLGNPFDLDAVSSLAEKHGLWLVEDCCDALGSRYKGRLCGTFGQVATASFFPAHHITMGEGGCVVTNRDDLRILVESFRDWGRDCWCKPGHDNTCRRRFDQQIGSLPKGYDHKYTYSHVGYNLKLTDMQAAVGVSQLKKLPAFVERRKENFALLHQGLTAFSDVLQLPKATPGSDPSWFGFLITVQDKAPFKRNDLIRFLDGRRIGTRLLFGGNLTRQPAFEGRPCRIVGDLRNSDTVMNDTFWIGLFPGLTREMIQYVVESFGDFMRKYR